MEEIKQVTKFKGEQCTVELRNGLIVKGILAFFNINEQIIHLTNYQQFKVLPKSSRLQLMESGDITVLNKYSWYSFKSGVEEIKNKEE